MLVLNLACSPHLHTGDFDCPVEVPLSSFPTENAVEIEEAMRDLAFGTLSCKGRGDGWIGCLFNMKEIKMRVSFKRWQSFVASGMAQLRREKVRFPVAWLDW